ncbi:hypothetical protein [Paenibacillus xylanexedens]|uniref:hypothetical protein n=1 Tax=Paenibacillus xylanexedens TaxID=528191 RepID=UPI0011A54545|nr:hypothetical protein [Paenibacillus xylanexedens]
MKKHVKNIGLVLSGVVLGVAISFSGEISAATSKLLGGKVGKVMTVTLNNKSIGEAPVIGGTSYVPVRTAANSLGLEVKVSGNEIILNTPEEQAPAEQVPDTASVEKKELEIKIEQVKRKIESSKTALETKEKELNAAKGVVASGSTGFVSVVDSLQKSYDESKEYIADQEKELSSLESQLAALDK